MITTNVTSRTFHIKWRNSLGTAFAIDHLGKQYLITARHVVEGIPVYDVIAINHEQKWKNINVKLVGTGADQIDVTVLSCSQQLSPPLLLEASAANIIFFQPVYFLGFPFGWTWDAGPITKPYFPMPFAKTGILSAASEGSSLFFIDGYNNKGFSGGPVVFQPHNNPSHDFQAAGIVVNYPASLNPIVDENSCPILNQNKKPSGYIQENTGFVVAVNIKHAIELIDANPIGFELPNHHNP